LESNAARAERLEGEQREQRRMRRTMSESRRLGQMEEDWEEGSGRKDTLEITFIQGSSL